MNASPQLGLPFDEAGPAAPAPAVLRFVRHRKARRYLIRVDRDGTVRVTIPRGGSRREAEAFARRNQAWIARQRARAAGRALPADEERRLRQLALDTLPQRLLALAGLHGLAVSRVSIRNPKARWGSCGHGGHICLNWRLVLMPEWVRDYVLIHELMHLKQMNHSPAYWALVAAACPGYREARAWLRDHGDAIA
ncbi:MAG: M48 family metallopeptidase [Vicinamibacterales bacterium]